jgi:hypothetical protein
LKRQLGHIITTRLQRVKIPSIVYFLHLPDMLLEWLRFHIGVQSARNGNLEVPVYFLNAKQGYTVGKWKKNEWI